MSAEDLIIVSGSVYLYFSLCRERTGCNEVTEYAGETSAKPIEASYFNRDQSEPWDQHIKEKLTQKC